LDTKRRTGVGRAETMAEELLIIEDDAVFGIDLKRHFEREGWRARLVRSLEEAEPFVM
jgi:two-component system, NtrC family, response regulator AtoC